MLLDRKPENPPAKRVRGEAGFGRRDPVGQALAAAPVQLIQ